jgi:hypothetical protein
MLTYAASKNARYASLVEITIPHAATRQDATQVIRDVATAYK